MSMLHCPRRPVLSIKPIDSHHRHLNEIEGPRPRPHQNKSVNIRFCQFERTTTTSVFDCAFRHVEIASAKVALNCQTSELLSEGIYDQPIARQQST
jgi:hypothetical protein